MSIFKEQAISKFKEGNVVDYNLSFEDFICDCYVRLKPCSYGSRIQTKIINEIGCKTIHPSENRGDFMIGNNFPTELKVSFLGQNGCYSLTHIRMWQKFKYYLFCFVDCENGFKPEFYLIDKYIMNMISMRAMNGTRKSNSENTNIELRVSVKKGDDIHKLFKRENKLRGTNFSDLISFVNGNKPKRLMERVWGYV